jgi:hypothetical protein
MRLSRDHIAPFAFFLLAILLFPSTGKTLDDIRRSFTRHWPHPAEWAERFQPRGGEARALPSEILDALFLVRSHGAASVRLAFDWRDPDFPHQRVLDALYPVRVSADANWALRIPALDQGGVPGNFPAGCTLVATKGGASLAHCP